MRKFSPWLLCGTVCVVAIASASCGGDSAVIADLDAGPDSGDYDATVDDAGADVTSPVDAADGRSTVDAGDGAVTGDASGDASTLDGGDAATSDAGDAATSDAAADAGCSPDNSACGSAQLCKAAVCSPCVDVTDDATCTSAYGGSSSQYLCLAGACAPGDCRQPSDCASNANGGLCGVTTPNTCGKCTSDSQCAALSAATPVCNTTSGQCVAGTCTPNANNPPATCAVNASDMCCTSVCQPANGAFPCCPGGTSGTYCATSLGVSSAACVNNVCTQCASVTNGHYLVDPNAGSDATGTGAPSCAFKTITRALQVIGTSPAIATTITVIGPSTVAAGETFPIVVPTNVTITTQTGAVTVQVPAGRVGFTLAAHPAGIAGAGGAPLTIDGSANHATFGVVASAGSTATTSLSRLTVQNFLNDGILVNGGVLTIGAGVTSKSNGTTLARRAGLHVTGTGEAIVSVTAGSDPTHFDNNTNHGIAVDASGFVVITGAVTSATAGTGTVTANANYAAGLWIAQNPLSINTLPQNLVNGLVAFGNTNGHGVRVFAGSNARIRNGAFLGNPTGGGIVVSALIPGGGATNDISKIDLGAGGEPGKNVVQGANGAGNNGLAGICLEAVNNTGTLSARGNTFRSADCSTTAAVLTINKGGCGNAACTGGICDLGVSGTNNDIDPNQCTHP